MKIAFFAESSTPFHGYSLNERPLGGIETGIIRLSEILASKGHEVIVFTSYKNPPESIPIYENITKVYQYQPYDVFVSVQSWAPFFYKIKSKYNFFWTGDGYDKYSTFGIGDKRVIDRVDAFLAASAWHMDTLIQYSGIPEDKSFVISNGVHQPYFENKGIIKDRFRLLYTTAPNRGLSLIPDILNEIRKKVPQTTIKIISGYSHYNKETLLIKKLEDDYKNLKTILLKTEGVLLSNNLLQEDLSKEFLASSIYCYPCTVEETCCISAMEAQFAGNVVITSDLGALPEIVGKSGITINPTNSFKQKFIDNLEILLTNDSLYEKLSLESQKKAKIHFTWENVSVKFEKILEHLSRIE